MWLKVVLGWVSRIRVRIYLDKTSGGDDLSPRIAPVLVRSRARNGTCAEQAVLGLDSDEHQLSVNQRRQNDDHCRLHVD